MRRKAFFLYPKRNEVATELAHSFWSTEGEILYLWEM